MSGKEYSKANPMLCDHPSPFSFVLLVAYAKRDLLYNQLPLWRDSSLCRLTRNGGKESLGHMVLLVFGRGGRGL